MTLYLILIILVLILISLIVYDTIIKQKRYNTIRKKLSESKYLDKDYKEYSNLVHKMRMNLRILSDDAILLPDNIVISLYEDAFKGK